MPVSGRPAVSVIVPARNEEACLRACLESLVSQKGVLFEIIVVDDASTDRTRSIADSFPEVRVVDPGPLPPGWTGKNNAVTAGAKVARGEWFLFTDADTVHKPGSLARAMAETDEHHAALLSYSPEQEVHGLWEKAIMPVVFAELARRYHPSAVSDPNSPAAAANGQYLLISRATYEAVGGHAALASNLLEDVALACAVKASGRRIFFRFGGDAVRTRMYRTLPQLLEGWTKNLVLLFPNSGRLALIRGLEFAVLLGGYAFALFAYLAAAPRFAIAASALTSVVLIFLVQRIRKAQFSWDANLLAILGLPLFSCLLLRSKLFHERGQVSWKGRTYAGHRIPALPVS
ncbi:MAG: glycosyltransferase family 2 protein [Terriglobales bacterium]